LVFSELEPTIETSKGRDFLSDEDLLRRVAERDQSAMAEIFDRYGRLVYSIALRVLKDTAAAEDVMQEIFFRLWQDPTRRGSDRGTLAAWLAVVARNRAVDGLRRRKPTDPVDEVPLAAKGDLAEEVVQRGLMEKLQRQMEKLPAEQHRPIDMAFFEGLTHNEIAERTGLPLGTIKTRIRSGLLSLREAVGL